MQGQTEKLRYYLPLSLNLNKVSLLSVDPFSPWDIIFVMGYIVSSKQITMVIQSGKHGHGEPQFWPRSGEVVVASLPTA